MAVGFLNLQARAYLLSYNVMYKKCVHHKCDWFHIGNNGNDLTTPNYFAKVCSLHEDNSVSCNYSRPTATLSDQYEDQYLIMVISKSICQKLLGHRVFL